MYARDTKVPIERSRAEIERLLRNHKCTQYITGTDHEQHQAMVQFRAHNRIVRFVVSLPDQKTYRPMRDVGQAERQRWRALLLVIRAKLEAVENKITTFEQEFLAHIVMPNDQTVGNLVQPLIDRAYASGHMPRALLPGASDTAEAK